MEEASRKWVTGCAIGCAVIAAIAALVAVAGYVGVRKMIRYAEETSSTMDQVSERFGRMSEFRPPPSGAIPASRIEAFLESRELTAPERERLEQSLANLAGSPSGEGGQAHGGVSSIRARVTVVPQMMSYLSSRGESLLTAGIGLGEYLYIYTLAYPVWLGTPVDDGPSFVGLHPPRRWEISSKQDDDQQRLDDVRELFNGLTLPMLRHQLEDVQTSTKPVGEDAWPEELAREIDRMERDHRRLPWQDGLPPQTAASLEPYRSQLEASYSPLCHPIELAVVE